MSAKSKKRLNVLENKLLKLDKLQLKDVICSICQSILIEPVTLPCFHDFCHRCFKGTIENNALCCPLCRLRIGSWLRTATKRNSLINTKLWDFLNTKFSREIEIKRQGDDIELPDEQPLMRLSVPGEIRSEYEAELQRLRAERLQHEQKHLEETELLIKKIQLEEQESQRLYIERLKQDELLAKKILQQESKHSTTTSCTQTTFKRKKKLQQPAKKLKVPKIDTYLAKLPNVQKQSETSVRGSSLLTDDTSTDDSPAQAVLPPMNVASPEVVPSYTTLIKSYFNRKLKSCTDIWNKENGVKEDQEIMEQETGCLKTNLTIEEVKKKGVVNSLLVSLPLPNSSVLQQKTNAPKNKTADDDSVDSMCQELCYFKPIEKISSSTVHKVLPLKVPSVRASRPLTPPPPPPPTLQQTPTRDDYIDSLCTLRQPSLSKNRPSAFVITSTMLIKQINQNTQPKLNSVKQLTNHRLDSNLRRRTRSMGSAAKEENETTPRKKKLEKKSQSERKPHLRSASKKSSEKKEKSPQSKSLNNNKVNLAVKNLSSPLNNCDVKQILEEQLRIEKIIEQEKKDRELARQLDAELNGGRKLRPAAEKRQGAFKYTLRPAKKVKV